MDPYLDTIPDERGEEIKSRIRERDGSDSKERPTKRARANTDALLSPVNDDQNIEERPGSGQSPILAQAVPCFAELAAAKYQSN